MSEVRQARVRKGKVRYPGGAVNAQGLIELENEWVYQFTPTWVVPRGKDNYLVPNNGARFF